jgi:hypothetical protein
MNYFFINMFLKNKFSEFILFNDDVRALHERVYVKFLPH